MKIAKVDVIPYSVPIRAFADAYTGFSVSNAVLVKITTDTGITGFGEGCAWEPEFYGLHLGKKIEAAAEALGLPCIAGTEIEPGFSLAAKLHLAASMKIQPIASEFTELSLLKEHVIDHRFEIIDGCVKVPDGLGFGVKLNQDVFERVRID